MSVGGNFALKCNLKSSGIFLNEPPSHLTVRPLTDRLKNERAFIVKNMGSGVKARYLIGVVYSLWNKLRIKLVRLYLSKFAVSQ